MQLGSFFRKGLGISKQDLARIDGELTVGKAAVCIMASPDQVTAVSSILAELGGKLEAYDVSEEVVQEAVTAAAELPGCAQGPGPSDRTRVSRPEGQALRPVVLAATAIDTSPALPTSPVASTNRLVCAGGVA